MHFSKTKTLSLSSLTSVSHCQCLPPWKFPVWENCFWTSSTQEEMKGSMIPLLTVIPQHEYASQPLKHPRVRPCCLSSWPGLSSLPDTRCVRQGLSNTDAHLLYQRRSIPHQRWRAVCVVAGPPLAFEAPPPTLTKLQSGGVRADRKRWRCASFASVSHGGPSWFTDALSRWIIPAQSAAVIVNQS